MIRRGHHNRHCQTILGLAVAVLFFALPEAAQLKTNFASSITSGNMTPMWVARERGLFKNHYPERVQEKLTSG